jgi:hypothetical protein
MEVESQMCYTLKASEQTIIKEFKQKNKKICYYCGKPISDLANDLTVDHKLPVSRGGKTADENLAICCKLCNQDKADLTEEEYIEYKARIREIHETNSTIKDMCDTINKYSDVLRRQKEVNVLVGSIVREVNEVETTIRTLNFNAADGYKLCKDLKDLLLKEKVYKDEQREIQVITTYASNQIQPLQKLVDNLLNTYKTQIRFEVKNKHSNIIQLKKVI